MHAQKTYAAGVVEAAKSSLNRRASGAVMDIAAEGARIRQARRYYTHTHTQAKLAATTNLHTESKGRSAADGRRTSPVAVKDRRGPEGNKMALCSDHLSEMAETKMRFEQEVGCWQMAAEGTGLDDHSLPEGMEMSSRRPIRVRMDVVHSALVA